MTKTTCGCGPTVCTISPVPASSEPVIGELSTRITWRDVLGGWHVRWGCGRMHYRISPGLYRIGQPDADSPVLVTANYKLTIDRVRQELVGLKERIVLAPVEIVGGLKWTLAALVIRALLDIIHHHHLAAHLLADVLPFAAALITGGLLVPLLLPWLPFRAFALKGAVAGALLVTALLLIIPMGRTEAAGIALLTLAITSYMAMMFTGSTTFTTLAGAKLEVRRALPPILISAAVGAVLRVTAAFV
jgi:hypothetical protein